MLRPLVDMSAEECADRVSVEGIEPQQPGPGSHSNRRFGHLIGWARQQHNAGALLLEIACQRGKLVDRCLIQPLAIVDDHAAMLKVMDT